MKRLIGVFICICTILYGFENSKAQNFSLGGKVGVNLASVTGEDSDEYANPKFGWNFGVVGKYNLHDYFVLQCEINHTERGCYFETVMASGSKSTTEKFYENYNYLELPVLLKMGAGKNVKFDVFGGPVFSYLLKAKKKGNIIKEIKSQTFSEIISKTPIDENLKNDMPEYDFGFVFGCGLNIPKSKELELIIDLRYYMSFVTNNKHKPEIDIRNEVISFNAGFVYRF